MDSKTRSQLYKNTEIEIIQPKMFQIQWNSNEGNLDSSVITVTVHCTSAEDYEHFLR